MYLRSVKSPKNGMFTDKRSNMGGKVTPMRGKDHLVACVCNGAVHRLYIEVASAMHRPLRKSIGARFPDCDLKK